MAETITTTETTVLQVPTTLRSLIEALFFAAREPLSVKQIQTIYEYQGLNGESRQLEPTDVIRVVDELNAEYDAADKPYRIIQIAGGYQFATLPVYAEWLAKLYKEQTRRKLSQSSIETLAIVAYKQPITKPEIESIRGVNCDYVLKTLLEKELVTIVGRATTVGRPLLYGTTKEFLKHFGLNDLTDLPRPREIQEILGESQFETERRMLEAQQGVLEKKEEDFRSRLPHIPKRKPGLDEEVKIIPRKRIREIKVREGDGESAGSRAKEELHHVEPDVTTEPVSTEGAATADSVSLEPVPPSDALPTTDGIVVFGQEEQIPEQTLPPQEEVGFDTMNLLGTRPERLAEPEEDAAQQEVAPAPDVGSSFEAAQLEDSELPAEEPGVFTPPEVELTETETTESHLEVEGGVESAPAPSDEMEQPSIDEPQELGSREGASIPDTQVGIAEFEKTQPDVSSGAVPQTSTGSSIQKEEPQIPVPDATTVRPTIPQPKSRWHTWKEKIQGFIRKLFG
ncbi:MAG: SMC-Scp complex subunit ScpB [Ignavibacteria bacterium]|nr:SMC-Scp complex subunit ScpB [Ignavibacteria bacterium]